jgi:hypothetical protein
VSFDVSLNSQGRASTDLALKLIELHAQNCRYELPQHLIEFSSARNSHEICETFRSHKKATFEVFTNRNESRYWDRREVGHGCRVSSVLRSKSNQQEAYLDYFALYANYDALSEKLVEIVICTRMFNSICFLFLVFRRFHKCTDKEKSKSASGPNRSGFGT